MEDGPHRGKAKRIYQELRLGRWGMEGGAQCGGGTT